MTAIAGAVDRSDLDPASERSAAGRVLAVAAVSAGAWLVVVVADMTGGAAALHHHALIVAGHGPLIAVLMFLLGWLVMVAAMMLPGSLPAVRELRSASGSVIRSVALFIGGYAIVWVAFGLLALAGDAVLHRAVDATPWLAERPWLIQASALVIAGGYQFTASKRRTLAACRHPGSRQVDARAMPGVFTAGRRHGITCLGSSWALMLVMFGAGFADLAGMVGPTVLMTYETTGRHGQRVAAGAGVVLILASVATLADALPPA